MSPSCDFRSDTVTLPTPEMLQAILRATLGDAARGDDATVNELEALCRNLLGMEDALFLPSASMANLAAVLAHDSRGGEVIVEESAHIYNSEGGALSILAGAMVRPVAGEHGVLSPDAVAARIRGAGGDLGAAPTRLLCVENTHNAAGGVVTPQSRMEALHRLASSSGIPLHLDGARLFNACGFPGRHHSAGLPALRFGRRSPCPRAWARRSGPSSRARAPSWPRRGAPPGCWAEACGRRA